MRSAFHLMAVAATTLMLACSSSTDPQHIIDRSIEVHGGDRFNHARIELDFRGRHYTAERQGGVFSYTREFTDTIGVVKDVLNNDGFARYVNGQKASVTDERAKAYTSSIDGVWYFALLPYRLNDAAVVKEYKGETTIKGKEYFKIGVTFQNDQGGVDFEDVFLYWINKNTDRVDYFAYSYTSEEGGVRFREATTASESNGIIIQNYINYKPKDEGLSVDDMEKLFVEQQLDTLSIILHEHVKVELL